MEVPVNLSMSEFEDPINFEPMSNVIRCPHNPAHYYQEGTLLKKIHNEKEYTQCSLANQWFVSTDFHADPFVSKAMVKIQEMNATKSQDNLEKQELKNKVSYLESDILEFKRLIKEQNEKEEKRTEEFKLFYLESEKKHEQDITDLRKNNELLEKRWLISEEKHKDKDIKIAELTKQVLILQKSKENQTTSISIEKILKIGSTFFALGGIIWSSKKIYKKLTEVYDS